MPIHSEKMASFPVAIIAIRIQRNGPMWVAQTKHWSRIISTCRILKQTANRSSRHHYEDFQNHSTDSQHVDSRIFSRYFEGLNHGKRNAVSTPPISMFLLVLNRRANRQRRKATCVTRCAHENPRESIAVNNGAPRIQHETVATEEKVRNPNRITLVA
jgi:hypothetical protein